MSNLQPSAFPAKGGVSPPPYAEGLRLKACREDPVDFGRGPTPGLVGEAKRGCDSHGEAVEEVDRVAKGFRRSLRREVCPARRDGAGHIGFSPFREPRPVVRRTFGPARADPVVPL